MTERQNEVLGKSIDEAEGELAVVVAAMDGIAAHIIEAVVHPAHVPLVAEAEAAIMNGARDARPGGRFLGDRGGPGILAEQLGVQLAQEGDRLEILVAAMK